MAYVIQNGESGYSMADFVSALEGKQNVLQSGVNIKTVDGKSVLGGGNLEISEREYSYDLTDLEEQLKTSAKTLLNQYNPDGKYITFGIITDLHESKDGVPYNPGGTNYGVVTSVPSIKLLGSICNDVGVDAVFCLGDLSTGQNITQSDYKSQMQFIADKFAQYIPCPYFFVDGNHERNHHDSTDWVMPNSYWYDFLQRNNHNGNLNVSWMRGVTFDGIKQGGVTQQVTVNESSLTYCVDFQKNGTNLRMVCISCYDYMDGASAGSTYPSIYRALKLTEEGKDPMEWLTCGVFHQAGSPMGNAVKYFDRYFTKEEVSTGYIKGNSTNGVALPMPINDKYGLATPMMINGHEHASVRGMWHDSSTSQIHRIGVGNAFSTASQNNTNDGYCFSVFVLDTDHWKLYEIQVGRKMRNDTTYPDVTDLYRKVESGVYEYSIKYNQRNGQGQ